MSTHTLPHSCVPSACPGGSPSGVAPGPYTHFVVTDTLLLGTVFLPADTLATAFLVANTIIVCDTAFLAANRRYHVSRDE